MPARLPELSRTRSASIDSPIVASYRYIDVFSADQRKKFTLPGAGTPPRSRLARQIELEERDLGRGTQPNGQDRRPEAA